MKENTGVVSVYVCISLILPDLKFRVEVKETSQQNCVRPIYNECR